MTYDQLLEHNEGSWYSEVCVGQVYSELFGSSTNRRCVLVILGPAKGKFVRPAWRVLVREPDGSLWIKDIHFFEGGNARQRIA